MRWGEKHSAPGAKHSPACSHRLFDSAPKSLSHTPSRTFLLKRGARSPSFAAAAAAPAYEPPPLDFVGDDFAAAPRSPPLPPLDSLAAGLRSGSFRGAFLSPPLDASALAGFDAAGFFSAGFFLFLIFFLLRWPLFLCWTLLRTDHTNGLTVFFL